MVVIKGMSLDHGSNGEPFRFNSKVTDWKKMANFI